MKILFVCTGNTCRSPMAEGIFKKILSDKGITDIECSSAGIFAMTGDEVTPNSVKACERFGVDISTHRARRITEYILDEADKFVCMTQEHAASLSMFVPQEKIVVLGGGIPDPFGGDLETYIRCANMIKNALLLQFDDITAVSGK
ncbi:MAG: low molecular weight protein arginine phosphatase [Oscillospiraceae bacterium]|nr:low molecular weight protein arginine phosphatase [Clostridiaceae bacterium]MDY5949111.1 low molecular weight protein arginine phosphatase [Oscillospiraceae bacterium]